MFFYLSRLSIALALLSGTIVIPSLFASSSFLNQRHQLRAQSIQRLEGNQLSLEGRWQLWADPHASTELKPLMTFPQGIEERPWKSTQVPSNWFLQGEDLSGVVWYRRHFRLGEELRNKTITLKFEGVDYSTEVWLNGQYLGFHEGYFQPFEFILSDQLQFGKDNVLMVRVNSPLEEATRESVDWSLNKRLIKGIFSHHDTRPGGAWSERGQEQNTGGIWAPVSLEVSEKLAIQNIQLTPQLSPQGSGVAEVELNVVSPAVESQTVEARLQLSPVNFSGPTLPLVSEVRQIQPGQNQLKFELEHPNPKLWWTWDHGYPHLYRVTVELHAEGKVLDTIEDSFGFRTIEFDPQAQIWKLNNRRIFIRGTNYIATQWLSEMTPERYHQDLQLMQDANINAVRVHAHILARDFYRQSDRAGMLIWQDFPLQWGYVEEPEFLTEATRQAKAMVKHLYNHASIAIWSLHNEPPWDADWMKYKYKSYDPEQNKAFNRKLFANLKGSDPTRHLHAASLTAEHPWWGWYSHSFYKYAEPTEEPMITEFGAQALPNLNSLQRIFKPDELWPDTEADWEKWSYHNFQKHETFDIAKVPMGNSTEELIQNTQQYQSQITKFAAEAYRRQRYQPVSSIFQFMFVENWPSMNWGVVDYWRQPKPGYEALKVAYQPVLPSLEVIFSEKEDEIPEFNFWVINDRAKSYRNARLQGYFFENGNLTEKFEIPLEIAADSGQKLADITQIDWEQLLSESYCQTDLLPEPSVELRLELLDSQSNLLGQNRYTFPFSCPPKEAKP